MVDGDNSRRRWPGVNPPVLSGTHLLTLEGRKAELVYHGEKIGRYVRNYLHDSMVAQLFIHYATAACELSGY